MTVRTEPPFRADHVGSLLRPPKLMTARQEHADGQLSDEELRAAEDEAISDVVAMQEEIGLRSAMLVPMRTAGRTTGVITFAEGARSFDADDLAFAQDLALLASLAVALAA